MLVTEKNAARCLERVARADRLGFDTETTGLDIWTGDRLVGAAVKAGGEKMYFPFRHGGGGNLSTERLPQLVEAMTGKPLDGFHLRYDMQVMHNEGLPLPPEIQDTLIAAVLMNENENSFALKRSKDGRIGLSGKYLGKDTIAASDKLDQLLKDRGLAKKDMHQLHPTEVVDYVCDDLDLPERLMAEVYWPGLRAWNQEGIFREYNDYQRLLVEMEIGGLPTDRAVIDRALAEGEVARAELLAQIHAAAGYKLNPQSPKQVKAWLGTPDAKEETILMSGNPMAEPLIDYKAYGKRDSTYLQRFIDFASPDGLLHCQLNLTRDERDLGGTRSARLSCSRPNLQAMPKPKTNPIYSACRLAIRAPEGFCIMEADYSQAEVRIAGHYSQEPALFDVFNAGIDIYEEFAAEVRQWVPAFDRQGAKILHLAIQYGAGAWKIAEMLGVSEQTAWLLRDAWHQRFPRISYMMRKIQKSAERSHVIKLFSGRYGHFDGKSKGNGCKSPYYTAWNRLIQGSVAEQIRYAMMALWPVIRALGGRMLLQVHDSILFLIPIAKRAEAARLIKHYMEGVRAWDIPAVVDIKSGPNWLDVQKEAA